MRLGAFPLAAYNANRLGENTRWKGKSADGKGKSLPPCCIPLWSRERETGTVSPCTDFGRLSADHRNQIYGIPRRESTVCVSRPVSNGEAQDGACSRRWRCLVAELLLTAYFCLLYCCASIVSKNEPFATWIGKKGFHTCCDLLSSIIGGVSGSSRSCLPCAACRPYRMVAYTFVARERSGVSRREGKETANASRHR